MGDDCTRRDTHGRIIDVHGNRPELSLPAMRIQLLRRCLGCALLICLTTAASAQTPATLAAEDRTAIQGLVSGYARTLGACAAEEYADLFAPGTGYFASGIRGHIAGREKLIALVKSERHYNWSAARRRQRTSCDHRGHTQWRSRSRGPWRSRPVSGRVREDRAGLAFRRADSPYAS